MLRPSIFCTILTKFNFSFNFISKNGKNPAHLDSRNCENICNCALTYVNLVSFVMPRRPQILLLFSADVLSFECPYFFSIFTTGSWCDRKASKTRTLPTKKHKLAINKRNKIGVMWCASCCTDGHILRADIDKGENLQVQSHRPTSHTWVNNKTAWSKSNKHKTMANILSILQRKEKDKTRQKTEPSLGTNFTFTFTVKVTPRPEFLAFWRRHPSVSEPPVRSSK